MQKTLTTLAMVAAMASPAMQAQETGAPAIATAFDMQRCVNMGNALEAPANGEWGGPLRSDKFAEIAAAGFDTVRIPIRWSDYTGEAPDFTIDPAFMDRAARAVDAALAEGLNVIINIHHFDALTEEPQANMRQFLTMWRQIATQFADYPDDLWFEVLNEPNGALEGDLMRGAQQVGVLAIRESNPDRIIILGGENWSGINSLGSNIAPPDENTVYTFHYYDPFDFTHQFASWVDPALVSKKRKWGSRTDKRELAAAVETATQFRQASGRPVFMGEFGVYEVVDNDERVEWAGAVREAMEAAGVPWCLWSFSNTFALYDEDAGWDADMAAALGVEVPEPIIRPDPTIERFGTEVLSREDLTPEEAEWGTFIKYFEGASWGTESVLSGIAEIKPGWEIHPPHVHAEEEYLMVLEGSGVWSVNGEEFAAKAGDMIYAAPWDRHGIRNTGDTVLKFVFWKWNSSGITPPKAPPGVDVE